MSVSSQGPEITINSLKQKRIKAEAELAAEKKAQDLNQFKTVLEELNRDPLQYLKVNPEVADMCKAFGLCVQKAPYEIYFVTVPEEK